MCIKVIVCYIIVVFWDTVLSKELSNRNQMWRQPPKFYQTFNLRAPAHHTQLVRWHSVVRVGLAAAGPDQCLRRLPATGLLSAGNDVHCNRQCRRSTGPGQQQMPFYRPYYALRMLAGHRVSTSSTVLGHRAISISGTPTLITWPNQRILNI